MGLTIAPGLRTFSFWIFLLDRPYPSGWSGHRSGWSTWRRDPRLRTRHGQGRGTCFVESILLNEKVVLGGPRWVRSKGSWRGVSMPSLTGSSHPDRGRGKGGGSAPFFLLLRQRSGRFCGVVSFSTAVRKSFDGCRGQFCQSCRGNHNQPIALSHVFGHGYEFSWVISHSSKVCPACPGFFTASLSQDPLGRNGKRERAPYEINTYVFKPLLQFGSLPAGARWLCEQRLEPLAGPHAAAQKLVPTLWTMHPYPMVGARRT